MNKNIKIRFLSFLCISLCLSFFCGCERTSPYEKYVSELRSDIFFGETENYKVYAFYGFKETPSINDGIVGDRVYFLEFRIQNSGEDGIKRTINFSFKGESYSEDFSLDYSTGIYSAKIELTDFAEKEITAVILSGAEKETITLVSSLPENSLTFKDALKKLKETQEDLLSLYKNPQREFSGEIRMRILLKDDTPYWYVGLCGESGKIKALLLDGYTGKVLAVREIF